MSTTPPASPVAEAPERARFLAVEVGGWPGIEQPVRLPLDERTTVLVGKNGAGKSLLVEGFYWGARLTAQWNALSERPRPRTFLCEVHPGERPPFAYSYEVPWEEQGTEQGELAAGSAASEGLRTYPLPPWRERGVRLSDGAELWRAKDSYLTIGDRPAILAPRGVLSVRVHDSPEIEHEARALAKLVSQVSLIAPGTLRRQEGVPARELRRAVLLQRTKEERPRRTKLRWTLTNGSEIDELGKAIVETWEEQPAVFEELREILSGLDLVKHLSVQVYGKSPAGSSEEDGVAVVLFDGTNIGFCSDGTLRIARIVLDLLRPQVSCLLIEEPETAVHPGLLDNLLAIVDAYSVDRQIVLSTHSPQVVDHFAPEQLRLVEREEGITRVHALSAADRDLAMSYLRDQGSLSDFVFRRSDR